MTETTKNTSHTISAIILAAGKGTRMKSTLPKVLHPVMGRSMVEWVIDAAKKAGATDTSLVLSAGHKPFEKVVGLHPETKLTIQKAQRGTGDAVASAAKAYTKAKCPSWAQSELIAGKPSDADWVLVCAGDTPAINPNTIRNFIQSVLGSSRKLGVLGMIVPDPKGYGRLVKGTDGGLSQIVEERDADAATKKINLCNSGVIFAKTNTLFSLLEGLSPTNSQNEYYLTDIFAAAARSGESAFVFETTSAEEFQGVNDRSQLASVEQAMMRRRLDGLMSHGVTIHLPETVFIEADVVVEPDVTIYPGAYLRGKSKISRNCVIGPQVVVEDSELGADVHVGAHAVLVRSQVAGGAKIPPQTVFADRDME